MQKGKKVLIFSTAYYPFVGGAEIAIKEITDRLLDSKFDLITCKFKRDLPNKERIGNVSVYRVGMGIPVIDKLLIPFWGSIKAIILNRKNKYDFYFCMMVSFASGAAYIANIIDFWNRVPIILNLQEGDSEGHFATNWFGMINPSWKLALKRTSYLLVLSNFLKERAKKFGYKKEIFVIPNGVDIKKFDLKDWSLETRKKERERLGLKENDIALITSSRLVEKNGIGDVIEAMTFLPERFKFIVCGVGELEKSLKFKIKELGLEDRVRFLGFVDQDKLPKILKACDIFIRPSLSEGFGISFIEAMAARIPVIATPVGGITDFLFDKKTGYFCDPQDPRSIAKTTLLCMKDSEREKIVSEAFTMVKEKYSWDLIVKDISIIFGF